MLIASLNQINCNGGYVHGWDTKIFKSFCGQMHTVYPKADVLICRDHCGPMFTEETHLSESMKMVYANLKADCDAGFDIIHIDMCHYSDGIHGVLDETKKAMKYCLGINPEVRFEVGTDSINGERTEPDDLGYILDELEGFPIEFYVVNTGSLVRDTYQVGSFDISNTKECAAILHGAGIKVKEHNSDYLSKDNIKSRLTCGVSALNIAPEVGYTQTMELCRLFAQNPNTSTCLTNWKQEIYESGKWKKWTRDDDIEHAVKCGGFYHFKGNNYAALLDYLRYPTEKLIEEAVIVIKRYCG
jgi:fructose/tagatose bisphosphate aldolase